MFFHDKGHVNKNLVTSNILLLYTRKANFSVKNRKGLALEYKENSPLVLELQHFWRNPNLKTYNNLKKLWDQEEIFGCLPWKKCMVTAINKTHSFLVLDYLAHQLEEKGFVRCHTDQEKWYYGAADSCVYWASSEGVKEVDRVHFKSSNQNLRNILRGLKKKGRMVRTDTLMVSYSSIEGTNKARYDLHSESLKKELRFKGVRLIVLENQNFFNTISLSHVCQYLNTKYEWECSSSRGLTGEKRKLAERALPGLGNYKRGAHPVYCAYKGGALQNEVKRGVLISKLLDEGVTKRLPGVICINPWTFETSLWVCSYNLKTGF